MIVSLCVEFVRSKRHESYNQSQGPATFGVDEEQCRDREDDLHGTVAQRGEQGLVRSVTGVFEDGRAVEGNDCAVS